VNLLEFDSIGKGWINENKFFGGRIVRLLMRGTYPHNHNIFYAPTMERTGTASEIRIERGSSNMFQNVRWEGTGNLVYFGENTYDNVVERTWSGASFGYQQGSYRFGTVEDYGNGNIVSHGLDKYYRNDLFHEISLNNLNFNVDQVRVTGNDLTVNTESLYKPFYETGLFRLVDDFTVEFASDSPLWRMFITLYDETGVKITNREIIEKTVHSFTMGVLTSSMTFGNTVNRDKSAVVFRKHPDVKYVSISLQPHGAGTFNYLKLINRSQNVNLSKPPVPKIYNELRGTKKPDFHTFPGTFARNLNSSDGILGWSYSNGAWHPFPGGTTV